MSEFLSIQMREFPGGLVVRTQHFHHCGLGTIPSLRTEVPHQAAAHYGPKIKINNKFRSPVRRKKKKLPHVMVFKLYSTGSPLEVDPGPS